MIIRPMRGQCVVREVVAIKSNLVWTPHDKRQKIHVGLVLALGPSALYTTHRNGQGVPVPWDCAVGDHVLYTWGHNEKEFTKEWSDGKPASWIPQSLVHGVVEGDVSSIVIPWSSERGVDRAARRARDSARTVN